MKHPFKYALSTLALTALFAFPAQATPPNLPSAIDQFVEKVFPNTHYHWIVNNTQTETSQEMILDINTFVTPQETNETPIESRVLLVVLNGEVMAAQKIPLCSTVDCGKDTEI
jgi:hypothetical protein